MSVLSFVSAKGSPGVSTTLGTLAWLWGDDVVLAELDPAGGDLALRHRGLAGRPLDEDRGLLSYGAAIRGGSEVALADHLQRTEDGIDVLVGVGTPGQARGLATAWNHIGRGLRSQSGDVLVDGGRYVPGSAIGPVLEQSRVLVVVARTDLPGVAHLRSRLTAIQETARAGGLEGVRVAYLLVGDAGDARAAADIEKLLGSAGLRAAPLGVVHHEPKVVATLDSAPGRRLRRSTYVRSVGEVKSRLRELAGAPSTSTAGRI